ncbi:hypothetical protein BpHYR1_005456 [Brachionus plicatilis]|uniref:Uncharacterized protein n=1 Tax=Brachionus plicatilis TaxID=10195 RepID=A0A3M7S3D1_BRAPC|nr:hypothetical protein BpHYR1_005456 [Brachionus plicatilis]
MCFPPRTPLVGPSTDSELVSLFGLYQSIMLNCYENLKYSINSALGSLMLLTSIKALICTFSTLSLFFLSLVDLILKKEQYPNHKRFSDRCIRL